MQRIIGLAVATFAFSTLNGVPAVANSATIGDANAFAQGRGVHVNVRVRRAADRRPGCAAGDLPARLAGCSRLGLGRRQRRAIDAAVSGRSPDDQR